MVDARSARFQGMVPGSWGTPAPAPRPAPPNPNSAESRNNPAPPPPSPPRPRDQQRPRDNNLSLEAVLRRMQPMPTLQDPNKQSNPVTSWLSSLGQPRVPKPMDIPNPNRLGIFGQPVVEKVDDKIFSLRHTPMPPPAVSFADEMAALGASFPAIRNGEETARYPELQRDEWGRTVRVPGSYLDEMSPLARPWRSRRPAQLVPLPVTPEALESRPRPPWWYSDDSPYPPSQ